MKKAHYISSDVHDRPGPMDSLLPGLGCGWWGRFCCEVVVTWDKVCELPPWGLLSSRGGCAVGVPVPHHLLAGLAPHPAVWPGTSPAPSLQPYLDIPGLCPALDLGNTQLLLPQLSELLPLTRLKR